MPVGPPRLWWRPRRNHRGPPCPRIRGRRLRWHDCVLAPMLQRATLDGTACSKASADASKHDGGSIRSPPRAKETPCLRRGPDDRCCLSCPPAARTRFSPRPATVTSIPTRPPPTSLALTVDGTTCRTACVVRRDTVDLANVHQRFAGRLGSRPLGENSSRAGPSLGCFDVLAARLRRPRRTTYLPAATPSVGARRVCESLPACESVAMTAIPAGARGRQLFPRCRRVTGRPGGQRPIGPASPQKKEEKRLAAEIRRSRPCAAGCSGGVRPPAARRSNAGEEWPTAAAAGCNLISGTSILVNGPPIDASARAAACGNGPGGKKSAGAVVRWAAGGRVALDATVDQRHRERCYREQVAVWCCSKRTRSAGWRRRGSAPGRRSAGRGHRLTDRALRKGPVRCLCETKAGPRARPVINTGGCLARWPAGAGVHTACFPPSDSLVGKNIIFAAAS